MAVSLIPTWPAIGAISVFAFLMLGFIALMRGVSADDLTGAFASPECAPGVGRPISAERTEQVLREYGFSVHEGSCAGAVDIVAALENSSADADREGFVGCSVRRAPIYGNGFSSIGKTEKQAAHWVYDNVECALYVRSGPERELSQLEAAMLAMGQPPD